MKWPYEDMLAMAHPVSEKHPPMTMLDRAAQFSPFAALRGYDGVIEEAARLTDQPVELDESSLAQINAVLSILASQIDQQPEVAITFFQPDERKAGGSYVTVNGRVKKVDTYAAELVLTDGTAIPFAQIVGIEK